MTIHTQIKLKSPRYRSADGTWSAGIFEVDEGMKDIILDVWDLGCRTRYSCQGGDLIEDRIQEGYLMYHAPYQRQVLEVVDFYSTIVERPIDCGNAVWPPGVWETVRFKPMKYKLPLKDSNLNHLIQSQASHR